MDWKTGHTTVLLLLGAIYFSYAEESTATTLVLATTVPTSGDVCKKYEDQNLTAYEGWPALITCSELKKELFFPSPREIVDREALKNYTADCIISELSSGKTVSNTSKSFVEDKGSFPEPVPYQLNDVAEGAVITYRVNYQIGKRCLYQFVHLRTQKSPELGCKDVKNKRNFEFSYNIYHELTCSSTGLEQILDAKGIRFKWYHNNNCINEISSSFQRTGNKLKLTEADFSMGGSYYCAAEYNGKVIPVVQYNVCVKYNPVPHQSIKLDCADQVKKVRFGENTTISCNTAVGSSKANTLYVTSYWYREGNSTSICESYGVEGGENKPGYQCSIKSSIEKDQCHSYPRDPPEKVIDHYSVNLTIINVKPSDLGVYELKFEWNSESAVRVNVTLEEDTAQFLDSQIAGISIASCLVVLIIVFLLFCLWRKKDVAWFLKKRFGRFDTESYTYVAYFAYYYDLTQASTKGMMLTKSLIEHLHTFLDRFGGTVYDEQRDPNVVSGDADNVKLLLGDCHRIILVLSPEYVKDQWSRYKTNTALVETIETGKKVIFITIPETDAAIKKLNEAPRNTLQLAMKRNVTIHWDGKVPFKGSIRRRLEYGLPKLQKPDYSRCMSNSFQAQLMYQNTHVNGAESSDNSPKTNGFGCQV